MSVQQENAPDSGPDDWAAQIRQAKSARRSKKWIGASAAAATVLVVTVGGAALVNVMGGGGPQPEDALPATAIAFAKLDLNPSAGQKLAAYRLSAKFPKIKSKVSAEETSIKESVFGTLFTGDTETGALSMGLTYKTDVAPWLGDRVGVGVFPDLDADKKPEVGVAIAFTDQDAAKVALDKAIANQTKTKRAGTGKGKAKMGYAFADDFVVVSDTTAHAAALVQAGRTAPLAGSAYAEDVKKLGKDQVAIAWADVAKVYTAVKGNLPPSVKESMKVDESKVGGRIIEGLHLDPSYLELTGMAVGLKGANALVGADAGADAALIESFPSGVLAAFTADGLGTAAGDFYTSVTNSERSGKGDPLAGGPGANIAPMVTSTMRTLGLDSPKKIETLLGAETGVVVGGDKITDPQFAIRTRGSNPDAAVALARKALADSQVPGLQIRKVSGPPGILVGTSPPGRGFDLVKETFSTTGAKLGGDEAFRQVIPADQKATFAAYVNLSKVLPLLAKEPSSDLDMETLKTFKAIGFTAVGGTDPVARLRLSFR